MTMKIRTTIIGATLGVAITLALGFHAMAQKAGADAEGVQRAVLDYVEGVYEVKPELIDRGVHPDLVKFGYWRNDETGDITPMPMNFEQLRSLAEQWNADGHIGADAPKRVTVHEVWDRTASASLEAAWGVDLMHLVKEDGEWKILQVLWQSYPPGHNAE
jgi:hypothetical protein